MIDTPESLLRPPPDPLADELLPLLDGDFALALGADGPAAPGGSLLRERLLARVGRSAHASRAFVTVRHGDSPVERPAPGVGVRLLYAQARPAIGRAGEPVRARLVEFAPGSRWQPETASPGLGTEWLLMGGDLRLGEQRLSPRDYVRLPPQALPMAISESGAQLYMREYAATDATDPPFWCLDARGGWDDFAPGIRRRVLWRDARGQAAMLYLAQPGAAVPCHGHGHDEECLMLAGELFLDDVLLRPLDYQLAPVGSVHGAVTTDTGAILFAHGDIDLAVQAP